MEIGAIQATAGGSLLLLALAVVWLAHRLKRKNQQLRKALAELQRSKEPAPVRRLETPPPISTRGADPEPTVDAFLWQHLTDSFLWKHLSDPKPAPVQLVRPDPQALPIGLCDRSAVEPFLESLSIFTGLAVLVGITKSRASQREHPAQPFIQGLLGPTEFACRNSEDEFLIVCPGLRGADAQRRLNEISERLWNFQLRGQGSFSVLFSWGGIGAENQTLSDTVASASQRMRQTQRSRVLFFTRKAG